MNEWIGIGEGIWTDAMQYGLVRFDTRETEAIQYIYDDDWGNTMNASISARLPDPALSFPSADNGSNVLDIIETYLEQRQIPICGSSILILLKRYPNQTDITELVAKLRRNHVFLTVMFSNTPSGGNDLNSIYELITRTNGFSTFTNDDNFTWGIYNNQPGSGNHMVYAQNVKVKGHGRIELAQFHVRRDWGSYELQINTQSHGPLDSFQYFNMTFTSDKHSFSHHMSQTELLKDSNQGNTTYVGTAAYSREPGYYNVSLEYNYSDERVETMQIRMLDTDWLDFWLPYDD